MYLLNIKKKEDERRLSLPVGPDLYCTVTCPAALGGGLGWDTLVPSLL